MTPPADRLRYLLVEAARATRPELDPCIVAAIVDTQMRIFEQVTVQTRNLPVDCDGHMATQHRLVALTPFQPGKDTPDA